MSGNPITGISMIFISAEGKDYQAKLQAQTKAAFGDKDKLTKEELFKNDSIFKSYNNMSKTAKAKFDNIMALDGDASTISYKEYQTLRILLDGELKNNKFEFDENISDNDQNGINLATETETMRIYRGVKSKEDIEAKEAAEAEKSRNLNNAKQQLSQLDTNNKQDIIKGMQIIAELPRDNSQDISNLEDCLKDLFKDQFEEYSALGNSTLVRLKDGSEICINQEAFSNKNNGEVVFQKVGYGGKKQYEVYSPQGEKISDQAPKWDGFYF